MCTVNLFVGGVVVYFYSALQQRFEVELWHPLHTAVSSEEALSSTLPSLAVTAMAIQNQLQQGQWLLWGVILLAAVLGLIVFWWVYRNVSKPMERVLDAADGLASGLDVPVSVEAEEQETREILISLRVMQEVLKDQMLSVEQANLQVSESLQYARKIQQSLLPCDENLMPEQHFVLWEPREEVGGDMFWQQQYPEGSLMAVLDSTGHGVPGAFLSMLGVSALHHIVAGHDRNDPATVLRDLNIHIKTSLNQHQYSAGEGSDDGMDIGLCFFDKVNRRLTFAGAKISLIVLRDGQPQVLKGDKVSVGYRGCAFDQAYTNHYWDCEAGDVVYLLSDGLTDQIGYHNGKRLPFGNKRLKRLLQTIHQQPFAHQMTAVKEALQAHQGTERRRDDITVFGFGVGEDLSRQEEETPCEAKVAMWINAI
jgi:serine phosphatase RsbU (regulator of sigma subunit)